MATRLVRGWTHLERQRGGAIGLRGPGETQLETRPPPDRRARQAAARSACEKVEDAARHARRARQRNALPRRLAGRLHQRRQVDAVQRADRRRASTPPTSCSRRSTRPLRRARRSRAAARCVLADTVGFIRDLPHDLVAAFRATLAEARDADLLLHVVDASDPERDAAHGRGQTRAGRDRRRRRAAGARLQQDRSDRCQRTAIGEDQGGHPRRDPKRTGAMRHASSTGRRRRNAARVGVGGQRGRASMACARRSAARSAPSACARRTARAGGGRRLRARLHAQGLVAEEAGRRGGWHIRIDAPRALVEPLFGAAAMATATGCAAMSAEPRCLPRAGAATYNPAAIPRCLTALVLIAAPRPRLSRVRPHSSRPVSGRPGRAVRARCASRRSPATR